MALVQEYIVKDRGEWYSIRYDTLNNMWGLWKINTNKKTDLIAVSDELHAKIEKLTYGR